MDLKQTIEAILFVAGRPVSVPELVRILEEAPERIPGRRSETEEACQQLVQEWRERGGEVEIVEVAEGFAFQTKPEVAPWVSLLSPFRPQRLSTPAIETLALIAYKQPITRGEIESLRGVDSAGVLKSLLEKRLLRIVGRKEEAGRPLLYATSKEFLETFQLKDLNALPPLAELEEKIGSKEPPSTTFDLSDLAANPVDLNDLEEGDREILGNLEDRLNDLKSTEKEILKRQEESLPMEAVEPLSDPDLDNEPKAS